jgi:hypothetical protein
MDVTGLEARLAALEVELESLRGELRTSLAERRHTMREAVRCVCGCRKLLHAMRVLDRGGNGRSTMALQQPSVWTERGAGELEAYVCTACGLVEWYAPDLQRVEVDGQTIRLLDGSAEAAPDPRGPYR